MVLDHIIFAAALGGSIVASVYDLKTTEVPNWVFYAIMIIGIPATILKFVLSSDLGSFAISGATGVGLLAFGYLMYRIGQWGGADMVLLALIGFMMPAIDLGFNAATTFPFGLSFLFNVFVIGAGYMIVYAMVFSLIRGNLFPKFKQDLAGSWKLSLLIVSAAAIAFTLAISYVNSVLGVSPTFFDMLRVVAIPTALVAGFWFVYKFARLVENVGFKKKIPISQLRVGDMLMSERKLVGVTREQISRMKRSGTRSVWIKDGVRFIPVFPIALLFTLYYGDAISLFQFLI